MNATSWIEARDLEMPDRDRVSFDLHRGELVALFCPAGSARAPLLRTIAGLDRPRSGAVLRFGAPDVQLVENDHLAANDPWPDADVLLVDAQDVLPREAWVRLATARALGKAAVIATSAPENAYRCDRIAPALWHKEQVQRALSSLSGRMRESVARVHALLDLRRAGERLDAAAFSLELRCVNAAARDLLAEAKRLSASQRELVDILKMSADIASVRLADRILDSLSDALE